MRWWLYLTAIPATVLQLTSTVIASPELAFPVNSQVPPVAFASQAYSFTFSPSTFKSDKAPISYSLDSAPAWLLLDSAGRTLHGTPTTADVGAATFGLQAQDDDGQTPSSVTLVVLQKPNLQAGQSILSSLQNAGSVSAPATLLLKPLEGFQIHVSPNAFSGTSSSTTYYAVSSDNSPLPPWIQFDPTTLTFSGSSPPLVSSVATQQTYGIHLVATEVSGFAEAVVTFQIAISYHILAFASTVETLAIRPSQSFASRSLRNSLTLDGLLIDDSSIASVNADLPSWASLDSHEIAIHGKVPADFQSQIVVVHVQDIFDDVASIIFDLKNMATTSGDKVQSIDLTTTAGVYFSYTFSSISLKSTDKISANLGNASNWLSFSVHNFTLHGFTPSVLTNQSLILSIIAEDASSKFTAQIKLQILPSTLHNPTMLTILTNSPSAAPPRATTDINNIPQSPNNTQITTRSKILIVLCTVLPSLAILAVIVLCLCYRRGRNKRNGVGAQKELSARASFQTEAVPDTADLPSVVEESRISNDRPRQITPVQIPQIDLFWAPDSLQKAKNRLSKRLRMKNRSIDSSWGEVLVPPATQENASLDQDAPEMSVVPHDIPVRPLPIPSYSARRQLQNGKRLSKQKSTKQDRRSVLSTISNHTAGLSNRISGAGHGGGVLVPQSNTGMGNRSSWQTTVASMPHGDTRPSMTTVEAFPPPLAENEENEGLGILTGAAKATMRLVEKSDEPSESFEIQRQLWHRERARNRLQVAARFSNAGSSRATSLNLSRPFNTMRSPSRTMSPSIPEDATIDSRMPSWSKWSGVGPAGRAEAGMEVRAPAPLFAQQQARHPPRDVSMASSGQFDSAVSSDSQWEDENLVAEVNEAGERHWLSDAESGAPSPRLPFETMSSPQEEIGQANQVGVSRGAKLIDKRKHVSVEEENLRRSEKSQAGSFRFI